MKTIASKAFNMAREFFTQAPQKAEELTVNLIQRLHDAGIQAMNNVYASLPQKPEPVPLYSPKAPKRSIRP